MSVCTPSTDAVVSPVYVVDDDPPVDPLMQRLMRHYKQQNRGRNLFLMSDGSVIDSQVGGTPPNMILPRTDPYATVYDATSGSLVVTNFNQTPYVTAIMYGGSDNPVTAAQVTQLTNAGYGSTVH